MLTFPSKPRYSITNQKSLACLLEYNLSDLPITTEAIFQIIQDLQCSVRTYSFHANKLNCSIQDICEAFGSIDGYSLYDEVTGKYKIAYNDTIFSHQRIRFTLMHEIGHIYLNHFIEFEQTKLCRGGLNEVELDMLDKEANYFASKVLAPEIILLRIGCETPDVIQERCAISLEAAKHKSTAVKKYGETRNLFSKLEQKVLSLFHNFVYQKHCINCHYYFISKNVKYCPICGNNTLKWGNGKSSIYDFEEDARLMFYYSWPIDVNGRVTYCPRCQNQEINTPGEFCKICRAPAINKCAGEEDHDNNGNTYYTKNPCNIILDGNARYCTLCGCESTFYQSKLLIPWEEEKQQREPLASTPPLPTLSLPLPESVSASKAKWENGKF